MALFGDDPKPPTTTSTFAPPAQAQQLINLGMPGLKEFASKDLQAFPGTQIAGFDPLQTQAQNMAVDASGGQATLGANAANTANFFTGGQIWNPESNAMLARAQDAAVRPIYQNLTQTALPAIRSGAIEAGGFGGSRQAGQEAQVIERTGRAAGDVSAGLAQNLYDTNIRAQLSALGLLPTVQGGLTQPAATVGTVGDVRQNQQQRELTEQGERFNFEQTKDLMKSKELLALAGAIPGGTTTATGSVPEANPFKQAVGGALSGAAAGSTFGPYGALIGGGIGAATPFLFS